MITGPLGEFTLIVPYYDQPDMLTKQIAEWNCYPPGISVILVDDGSPTPAAPIALEHASVDLLKRLRVLRINVDIPWNRGGARNLGATACKTRWMVHVDIDHVLPFEVTEKLLDTQIDPARWYRFNRHRMGQADATRRKDKIDPYADYGAIHPHIDSYAIARDLYWRVGGYDEDYSGCLGGGTPFLRRLEDLAKTPLIFQDEIHLIVFTRSVVADASVLTLDRSTEEFSRRRRQKEALGDTIPRNPLRFTWQRVL
jgi:hypothetical protein